MCIHKFFASGMLLLLTAFIPFHSIYGQTNPDDFDRFNIRVNWFVLSGGAMDVDIRLTPRISAGPSVGGWGCYDDNLDEPGDKCGLSGQQGVRVNYYMNSVFQNGFYISPGIYRAHRQLDYNHNGEVYDGSFTRASLSVMGGYMMQWSSGFNIKVGLGGATLLNQPSDLEVTGPGGNSVRISPDSPSRFLVEVNLGFSF